jgi:multidrug resistance efflux pump
MDLIPANIADYTLESYLIKVDSRSKIIYWIIIGTVMSGIALLPFIMVDVSVQARGYFQSDIEKQIIYIPFHGKVIYSSFRSGNKVHKGDTLIIIDSESLKAQKVSINKRIAENAIASKDLELLTRLDSIYFKNSDIGLETKRYKAEYLNTANQQIIQFNKYIKKKSEHERNEILFNKEIIPEADFENSLYIIRSEKDNLNQIILSQKSEWQADLAARKDEAIKLYADLEKCNEDLTNRVLLAPTDGEIIQSVDIQLGSILNPGLKIGEISPDGELIASCFVKPDDIGLISVDQKVRIQIDAFNYREWGMLPCDIINISDDMIVSEGSTAYFRIKCKPERNFLSLKNGKEAYIKKGMSFNARIVIIRRSLYHLLFDKADKWFNPYMYHKN